MALDYRSVKFLQGPQANVDALITAGKGATEGAFYLTNDTHRLYIGKDIAGNGNIVPVPVNQGVISVKTTDELLSKVKRPGEFYYITGTQDDPVNILCVYNGQDLVQINSDTFVDTYVSKDDTGLSREDVYLGSDGQYYKTEEEATEKGATVVGNAIKITFDLAQTTTDNNKDYIKDESGNIITPSHVDESYASTISSSIYLTKEDFDSIIGTSVDVKATCDNNGVLTIKTTGIGASEDTKAGFKLSTVGDGIKIEQALDENNEVIDDSFTITGTTYRISEVTASNAGKIKVSLTGTGADDITKIGLESGADLYYKLDDNEDDTKKTKIYNQGTLPIYKIIADELKGVNAMTYKGTVGIPEEDKDPAASYTTLPTTKVAIGDTFMVAYDGDFAGYTATSGDLFIAAGTEGEDGYITAASLKWTWVPAGNIDTTYSAKIIPAQEATDNSIALPPAIQLVGSDEVDSYIYFDANLKGENDNNSLSLSIETDTEGNKSLVYSHKNYTTTGIDDKTNKVNALNGNGGISSDNPLTAEQKFTVISGAKIENGHVTEFVTTDHYLPEDRYTKYNYTSTIANSTETTDKIGTTGYVKKATLTSGINGTGTDTNDDKYTVTLKSDTLAIKTSTNNTALSCEVDLLWGSF